MGGGKGKGKGDGKGKGKGKSKDPEAAFKAFMRSQKETLQKWAQRRSQWMEEINMSNEMESVVCELLEDLRDESTVQLGSDGAAEHDGTVRLLTRACHELKFHLHHVQQAVAILLAREGSGIGGGGVTLRERPDLLSSCLDWLCVNVPVDELPLKFRPKLRPRVVQRASGGLLAGASGSGSGSGERGGTVTGAVCHQLTLNPERGTGAPAAAAAVEWACSSCTLLNASGATRCEACGAPISAEEGARVARAVAEAEAEAEAALEAAMAAKEVAAVTERQLARLAACGFLRGRCRAALDACGGSEEAALASLVRGMLAKLCAAEPCFGQLSAPCADAEEAAALETLRREEVEAMRAILGTECEEGGGGVLILTLLCDPHTGEAPWAYSAAHAAPVALERAGGGRCTTCVIPGCRDPTNRHRASAYCSATHAAQDPDGSLARLAGFAPDGGPSAPPGLQAQPDVDTLRSLQLLVCTAADDSAGGWPYPRAPPLVAVRCPQLLPSTQLELSRLVLRRGAEMAVSHLGEGSAAPMLYEVTLTLTP